MAIENVLGNQTDFNAVPVHEPQVVVQEMGKNIVDNNIAFTDQIAKFIEGV